MRHTTMILAVALGLALAPTAAAEDDGGTDDDCTLFEAWVYPEAEDTLFEAWVYPNAFVADDCRSMSAMADGQPDEPTADCDNLVDAWLFKDGYLFSAWVYADWTGYDGSCDGPLTGVLP